MSTLIYAQLTRKREDAHPDTGIAASAGVQKYVDVLAALVLGEVLSAYTAMLSLTAMMRQNAQGEIVTTMTQPGTLRSVFVALLVLSILLFVVGHRVHWDRLDVARMLIPLSAFVGWTM